MSPKDIQNDLAEGLKQLMEDEALLDLVYAHNEWFMPALVSHAIKEMLPWFTETLPPMFGKSVGQAATIGIVMAGNIPLVGLHDLWMVLLAGHQALVRTSSKDALLMRRLVSQLSQTWQDRIVFTDDLHPEAIDFLIATGSNNTARYLEQRYAQVPRLIRKNRYSVGILSGGETEVQLASLAKDMLMYHGMGCRSVSNLLVKEGMDLNPLQKALEAFPKKFLAEAWFKVVAWENATRQMLDQGHHSHSMLAFQMKEKLQTAPVGVVNLVTYGSEADRVGFVEAVKDEIQCVVGHQELPFGRAQSPSPADFADDVNTYELLLKVKPAIGRQ